MRSRRTYGVLVVSMVLFSLMVAGWPSAAQASGWPSRKAKNIIFMVADGMGLADVTAARIFYNGPDGDGLSFETFDEIGYQRTYSANAQVTDSSAAASAWACGDKFNNGEISCHDDDLDGLCDLGTECTTPLEIAEQMGKSTGLVVTVTVTHATPAVWGAHVHHRYCETSIFEQYIKETGVDVILGGGIAKDRSTCMFPDTTNDDIAALVQETQDVYGYEIARTVSELGDAVDSGNNRIVGLFQSENKTSELFRVDPAVVYPEEEPTLPEMAQAALDVLERNPKGFFLMIEGSLIDYANHANDINWQISELLAFDESVELVLDWINQKPCRRMDTLVVVIADHETGGFAINGPTNALLEQGDIVTPAWTATTDHTGSDTMIWSRGPGSANLGKALENTDMYDVLVHALK